MCQHEGDRLQEARKVTDEHKIVEGGPPADYHGYQQRLLTSLIRWSSKIFALGVLVNSVCFLWDFWNTLFQNTLGVVLLLICWRCLRLTRQGRTQQAARIYLVSAMAVTALVTLFIGQNLIPNVATFLGLLVLIAIFLESPDSAYRWGAMSIVLYLIALTLRIVLLTRELTLGANDLVGLYAFPAMFLAAFAFIGGNAAGRLNRTLAESERARCGLERSNQALQEVDAALRAANERLHLELTERQQMEEALKESEENFRALAENANDGIMIATGEGVHVYANRRAAEILAYSVAELLETTIGDIVHPDDLRAVMERHRRRMAGKPAPRQYEVRIVRKDGTVVPVEVVASRTMWKGQPATIVVLRDIAERKRAEEEAQQYTAQLEALREVRLELTAELELDTLLRSIVLRATELVAAIRGAFYVDRPERGVLERTASIDPHGAPAEVKLQRGEGLAGRVWETGEALIVDRYEEWEGRAAVWEGYPVGSVIGVPVRWGSCDEGEFLGVLSVAAGTERAFSLSDARLLSLLATETAVAIRNAQLYEQARQEVAERRRAERALRESEERWRSLVENAPQRIMTLDRDGMVLFTNRTAPGRSPSEVIGTSVYQYLPPKEQDKLSQMLHSVFESGEAQTYEATIVRTDGTEVWYENSLAPIRRDGQAVAAILLAVDITERIQAQEMIAERERDLRSLSARLISAQEAERLRISQELHDEMGQALTAMRINLAAIQEELLPECTPTVGERLAEASWLADHALEQMRELAHELRPSMLDDLGLVPALHWYVNRFSKRLEVVVEFEAIGLEERLPAEVETALYRVVQEALTNVARHAQARTVWMRLERTDSGVVASIEDDGQGFDVREAGRRASSEGGAGLIGMRERVASVGGSLSIKSTPGKGTLLSIDIPARL
jgi:PAS domain S-box-containing protein